MAGSVTTDPAASPATGPARAPAAPTAAATRPPAAEVAWQAVLDRDPAADGLFVFAVRTTGVYCRPSCSSRRARRENVSFFATPTDAEEAGFRACKRCRPATAEPDPAAAVVREVCALIEAAEREPDLATLARAVGYSPSHLQRVFKAAVGLSPKQYALATRRSRLRAALPDAASVTEAIYEAGFGSASRAYEDASALGMSPGTYRRGAEGEVIRHTSAASSQGPVFVAATEHGVCMIAFGAPDQLAVELARRFPKAAIMPAKGEMAEVVAQVVGLVDQPSSGCDLPLDIRGTAFQERVWLALTRIPAGETISYTELARRVGQPSAARAVARACATNELAVAIPCHRVVSASGDLAGYRWGLERKRALLEREAADAEAAAETGTPTGHRG